MAEIKQSTNAEILEVMRDDLSNQGVELPAKLNAETMAEVRDIVTKYPANMNAFINTLTNKIVKSKIYSKNFTNPLGKLKKGYCEYGEGIEQLFVLDASIKNFGDNSADGGTDEGALIRKRIPEVKSMYITINYDKEGKATVTNKQLRKAFMSETGLAGLVASIVQSVQNGLEKKEFKTTKNLIGALIQGKQLDCENDTISETAIDSKVWKQGLVELSYTGGIAGNSKKLLKDLRTYARNFTFPSNKYNPAQVETWSNKEDLVFITTPEVESEIDVETLASAFNPEFCNIKYDVIIVDEIPTTDGNAFGVLMDKDFLQIWDTWKDASSFYNPKGQYTNYFGNNENIFAGCLYAQAVVFKKGV